MNYHLFFLCKSGRFIPSLQSSEFPAGICIFMMSLCVYDRKHDPVPVLERLGQHAGCPSGRQVHSLVLPQHHLRGQGPGQQDRV